MSDSTWQLNTAFLEIDGVLNIYAPNNPDCDFHMVGTQPVWLRKDIRDMMNAIAAEYRIVVLSYWDKDEMRELSRLLPPVVARWTHADRSAGWENTRKSGIPTGSVHRYVYSKFPYLKGPGVWIDPEADLFTSYACAVAPMATEITEGLTWTIVDDALKSAQTRNRL